MRLFTPFTISKKENCDLCMLEPYKKNAVENNLLDNRLKTFLGKNSIFSLTSLHN